MARKPATFAPVNPKRRLLYVEFDTQGRPFSVFAVGPDGYCEGYDVEYCRRDDRLYSSMSSAGFIPDEVTPINCRRYWLAAEMEGQIVFGPQARRLKGFPRGWSASKVLELIEGDDVDCYSCSFCDDEIPWDSPCDHVWECGVCGYENFGDDDCCEHAPQCAISGRPQ